MTESASPVTVALRIPGRWSGPKELIDRMPAGYRLTPEALILPDKTQIELGFMDADSQFADIFRSSCRQEPTDEEKETVDGYTVNVLLRGPGGSLQAARTMLEAGAAIVAAGAGGVFIDNCGLAHGGQNWLGMADDGGPDAVSFAFVGIVRGDDEVWTMGMHVLGLRDIVMKRDDIELHDYDIVEVIRYMAAAEKPIENGHIVADTDAQPQFQAIAQPDAEGPEGSPMFNPFGRLKLISLRDIGQSN